MITKDTASRIARAYSELEDSEWLLRAVEFGEADVRLRVNPLRDATYRLLDVSNALGKSVIKSHIESKRAEIGALCELAKTELEKETTE